MKEIKNILSGFSVIEKRNFRKYLNMECPDSVYISFFQLLLGKDTKSKLEIFEILYPNEEYKDGRLRLVLHRAKKILLHFIASQSQSEKDSLKVTHQYLKKSKAPQLQKSILKQTIKNYCIEEDSFQFSLNYDNAERNSERIIQNGDRAIEPKLYESHQALDHYYFIEKLKLACNTANYSRISGYEYQLDFLEPVVNHLSKQNIETTPLLYLYFHTYQMIATQTEEEFNLVFSYLQSHTIYENDDYREILISCLNFCIQRINRGQHEYAAKTLEVYKQQISSRNIYQQNTISSNTYKNIANLGLRLKEYDWTLQFIESEKSKLNSPFPLEDYQFVKARYHYELGEYEDCIRWIVQSRPSDILDNLQFRILLCKAYYELDDYEQADNAIHNAKLFLKRHRSKSYQLRLFVNFFRAFDKLLRYNYTVKSKHNLSSAILETNPIAEKHWLESKLKELG